MPFRDDFRGSAEKALESAAEIILSGDLNVILLEQTHCLLEKHLICKNKYVTSCVTNPYNCCVFICFSSSCVSRVASFSGLSVVIAPSVFSSVYFPSLLTRPLFPPNLWWYSRITPCSHQRVTFLYDCITRNLLS